MRNLSKTTKKALSFVMALLMVVSTIFVSDIQVKADETILEKVSIEFDVSKLSFELGANGLEMSEGFINGPVEEPDWADVYGEWGWWEAYNPETGETVCSYDENEEYKINETDEYKIVIAYFYATYGQYFSKSVVFESSLFGLDENPDVFGELYIDDEGNTLEREYGRYIKCFEIYLGTGAEILKVIEEANNPQEPSESESQEPSESESQEPSESESQEPSESESEEPSESESEEPSEDEKDYSAKLESDVASKVELTEDEKTAIANGDKLEIVLGFKDAGATATTDEQKAIKDALTDKVLGTFLDIDLTKKVGTTEVAITETTGLVAITFELPDALKNTNKDVNRTYSVLRYHDGKVDTLDAKYDAEKGTLTFETDKFSTYAVVYSDVTTTPNMGDASAMFLVYLVLGAGLIVVASRKKARI